MLRLLGCLVFPALLGLAACEQPAVPLSGPAEGEDKELGAIRAIYPHMSGSGIWYLEYRLTLDTVFVDFEEARGKAADLIWKKALTTGNLTFYDNGKSCMYARTVAGCLPFLKKAGLP